MILNKKTSFQNKNIIIVIISLFFGKCKIYVAFFAETGYNIPIIIVGGI